MRETVKSLRAYFIIAGLLSIYSNGTSLMSSPGIVALCLSGASLLMAIAYLYVGAVLPSLLVKSTSFIYVLLAFNAALSVLYGALLLVFGSTVQPLVMVVVSLVISAYLYANVKRLAAEARPEAGAI